MNNTMIMMNFMNYLNQERQKLMFFKEYKGNYVKI